jgi:NTP pyrophosphatase (non-canonical NTP hydrolase)
MRGSLVGKGDGWNVEELDDAGVARQVAREIERQDKVYGPFADDAAAVRLAVACLEDEVAEVLEEWRKWKRRPDWYSLRQEVVQVAALASRLARIPVEVTD